MRRRLAAIVAAITATALLWAVPAPAASAKNPPPPTSLATNTIDAHLGYMPQTTCSPKAKPGTTALAVWGFETGFEAGKLAVIGEQDILGDRLVRPRKKTRRPQDFINELSSLTPGDIVVHVDHGIGRFVGLQTITAAGAPHDCLEIHYAGDAKLFLPAENIELLSRYGSEDTEVVLDRLGGGGWQARKAKLKQRIREMAGKLIQIAAARALKEAPRLVPQDGLYDEFCARFPYEETEDQQNTIDAVLDDLAAGRPMDRLVCGDVGFGKTEVALRAAFAAALNGKQVAVVVPTTMSIVPSRAPCFTALRSAEPTKREACPTWTGKPAKRSAKLR